MRRLIYLAVPFLLLGMSTKGLQAEVVRFDFTGTVTSAFDNDPNSNPDTIFGAIVGVGDPVTGHFSFDTSAAETDYQAGLTGGASGYLLSLPYQISVEMGGASFQSNGDCYSTVVNDFTFNAGDAPWDAFGISDGVTTGTPNLSGDTILVNNVEKDGWIQIQFDDFDGTALDSTTLPSMLNLADFEAAQGQIRGTDTIYYSAAFQIDSIQVSAVPEPSSIALLAIAALGLLVTRGRRRKYS